MKSIKRLGDGLRKFNAMVREKRYWKGWELIESTDEYELYKFDKGIGSWGSQCGYDLRLMISGKFKAEGNLDHVRKYIPND